MFLTKTTKKSATKTKASTKVMREAPRKRPEYPPSVPEGVERKGLVEEGPPWSILCNAVFLCDCVYGNKG